MRFFEVTMAAAGLFLLSATTGFTDTISATGGLSFGRDSGMNNLQTPGPLFGVEYALPVFSKFQFGGFFDYSSMTSSTGHSDSISFMGAVLRMELGREGSVRPFVDGKAGMAKRVEGDQSSGLKMTYGAGAGIKIPVSKVTSFGPRFDIKYLPDAPNPSAGRRAALDCGLMFSFTI